MSERFQTELFAQPQPFKPWRSAVMPDLSRQGQQANKSGRQVEAMVAGLFLAQGCQVRRQVRLGSQSVFGTELRADVVLPELPLIVECKWQDSRGSTDEKLPYLVANIRAGCYPHPVIVLLDGAGTRPGAVDWMKRQVDQRRLLGVFSFSELVAWVMHGEVRG